VKYTDGDFIKLVRIDKNVKFFWHIDVFFTIPMQNKEERYGRVSRLSDTRYSVKGTKGKWRYASSKARLKCATYPRSQYMVMWAVDKFRRYGR